MSGIYKNYSGETRIAWDGPELLGIGQVGSGLTKLLGIGQDRLELLGIDQDSSGWTWITLKRPGLLRIDQDCSG